MSPQKLTETLFPVRIDKPLKLELERLAEHLGLPKSDVVRFSLKIVINPPSQVEKIMEEWKKDVGKWYQKRERDNGKDHE